MARRSTKTEPADKPANGSGHNSGEITDDQKAALQHHHIVGIIQADKAASLIKARYDEARAERNKRFAALKGDLGYSRKQAEEIIAALSLTETAFRNNENARRKRLALAGLNVGEQLDTFAGDTVDDALEAEANGYRVGRRADDREPPSSVAVMFHSDWLRGWDKGQDENAAQFLIANEVQEAKKAKAGDLTLNDEPPAPTDPDEEIEQAVDALEAKGWTQPTAEERTFEEAAA